MADLDIVVKSLGEFGWILNVGKSTLTRFSSLRLVHLGLVLDTSQVRVFLPEKILLKLWAQVALLRYCKWSPKFWD